MTLRRRTWVVIAGLALSAACTSDEPREVTASGGEGDARTTTTTGVPVASSTTWPWPTPASHGGPGAIFLVASENRPGESEAYALEAGSSCWTGPGGSGLCRDTGPPEADIAVMQVRRGATVQVRWHTELMPVAVEIRAHRRADLSDSAVLIPVTAINPSDFVADFEQGVHYLHVVSEWQYGDASSYAKLEVV